MFAGGSLEDLPAQLPKPPLPSVLDREFRKIDRYMVAGTSSPEEASLQSTAPHHRSFRHAARPWYRSLAALLRSLPGHGHRDAPTGMLGAGRSPGAPCPSAPGGIAPVSGDAGAGKGPQPEEEEDELMSWVGQKQGSLNPQHTERLSLSP